MKLVIFAGGLGTRMREETEFKPKPMVEIGGRPVLWHIMKIFSSQGVNEFIVLTGYKGESIAKYFLDFEALTQNFTKTLGQGDLMLHGGAVENWTVTVLDTGVDTPTAGRLLMAKDIIGEEPFFCTYGDGLADVDLGALVKAHKKSQKIATLTAFQPKNRFGILSIEGSDVVSFKEKPQMSDWVNIGFFYFEPEIFDWCNESEMLEGEPLINLAASGELAVNFHYGFWEPMDTFREYSELNRLWNEGEAPWKIW
jgi:glucose-1-phosphate cytidylyltransferase